MTFPQDMRITLTQKILGLLVLNGLLNNRGKRLVFHTDREGTLMCFKPLRFYDKKDIAFSTMSLDPT